MILCVHTCTATEVAARGSVAGEGQHTEEQGGDKTDENKVGKTESSPEPTCNGELVHKRT